MPKGKTVKSERTRAAIRHAARHLFTEHGFDRTTVREIAAAAETDAALVIRYFGSKEGLFSEVAEPDLQLPALAGGACERIGETLVGHFLEIWEGGGGLPVLLRSAASNPAAAERLEAVFAGQVLPMVAATGSPASAPQRAGLIASQLLGLALTRYVLRLPPAVSLSRELIVREVGATIQRYMMLEDPQPAR